MLGINLIRSFKGVYSLYAKISNKLVLFGVLLFLFIGTPLAHVFSNIYLSFFTKAAVFTNSDLYIVVCFLILLLTAPFLVYIGTKKASELEILSHWLSLTKLECYIFFFLHVSPFFVLYVMFWSAFLHFPIMSTNLLFFLFSIMFFILTGIYSCRIIHVRKRFVVREGHFKHKIKNSFLELVSYSISHQNDKFYIIAIKTGLLLLCFLVNLKYNGAWIKGVYYVCAVLCILLSDLYWRDEENTFEFLINNSVSIKLYIHIHIVSIFLSESLPYVALSVMTFSILDLIGMIIILAGISAYWVVSYIFVGLSAENYILGRDFMCFFLFVLMLIPAVNIYVYFKMKKEIMKRWVKYDCVGTHN